MRIAIITELDAEGYPLRDDYERQYNIALDLYCDMEDYLSTSDECRKIIATSKEDGTEIFRLQVNPETGEIEELEPPKPKRPFIPRKGFGGAQPNAGRPKGSKNYNRKGYDKDITIRVTVPMWRYLKRMKYSGDFIRSAIQEKHDRLFEERKKYIGKYSKKNKEKS